MNILFCDDEPELLEIYELEFQYLSPENTYFTAESPEKALEICKVCEIDILFTDSKMPNMSGIELLRALKANGTSPKASYMITGYTSEFEEKYHEIYDYVHEVLPKPPNFDYLLQLVKKNDSNYGIKKAPA